MCPVRLPQSNRPRTGDDKKTHNRYSTSTSRNKETPFCSNNNNNKKKKKSSEWCFTIFYCVVDVEVVVFVVMCVCVCVYIERWIFSSGIFSSPAVRSNKRAKIYTHTHSHIRAHSYKHTANSTAQHTHIYMYKGIPEWIIILIRAQRTKRRTGELSECRARTSTHIHTQFETTAEQQQQQQQRQ